jgi:protocadherin Fat 1/2/3
LAGFPLSFDLFLRYITYSIANLKPTPFTIDTFTGEIRTGRLLDYEIDRREFGLKIRASDWAQPSRRQSQKTIKIQLKDINENRPLFTVTECVGVIDSNIKFETELGQLQAIDFDRDDMVTYRIVGGNEDGCFGLDGNTGKLRVLCDLREVRVGKRLLNVTATDGEYYSDVMMVKVELWDGRINGFNKSDSAGGTLRSGMEIFSTIHSIFECEDRGVQERFDRMAALSELNNQFDEMDLNENGFPPLPSRYGENVHVPQFVDFPKEIRVSLRSRLQSCLSYTFILCFYRN